MSIVRIIPCLDVKNNKVVKGVNFKNLKTAGSVTKLAEKYYNDGADELTFLDISASEENRGTFLKTVQKAAEKLFIPLTVGGGIRSVEDVSNLLKAGADKVSVNTSAVKNPNLLKEISNEFGKQILVLSADAKRTNNTKSGFEITIKGGKELAGLDLMDWIETAQEFGVGEILLNSMDADGTKSGFDLKMLKTVREICSVPLIASGGAGKLEDFIEVVKVCNVDAILAASVFHYNKFSIQDVKQALKFSNINIR